MVKYVRAILTVTLLVLTGMSAVTSFAEEKAAKEEKREAVTTGDPYVAVEELELILTAYTKEELLIEAEAWQQILRNKAVEIGKAEIAVKRQNYEIQKAEEIQEQAHEAKEQLKEVERKAEQAEQTGDARLMNKTEKATEEAQEIVSEIATLVDEAADAAEKTAVVRDRLADSAKKGLEETIEAAEEAEEILAGVQEKVTGVNLEDEGEVKEAAGEVADAAEKASEATTTVEEHAEKAVEGSKQEPEDQTDVMRVTEKLMHKIEGVKKEEKEDLLEWVNKLREERTLLVDNFKAVISELSSKTDEGDSETLSKIKDYQLYARSVMGIHLDVKDTTSSWIAIKGWLLSDEGGLRFAFNFFRFVSIIVITWIVARFVGGMTKRALGMTDKVSMLLEDFLSGAARWIVMAVGTIMALSALEVSVAPLLAVVGAAGFVIAFALQDSLSNFASGIMILFFRPFDVGDFVDAGGVSGEVTTMNLVSTTITTVDNKKMVVPNNKIWHDVIVNVTGVRTRRIDFLFGIGYEADIDKAKEVLWEIVTDNEKVLKKPEPRIRVHELADSSVNLICRPWVRSADYWETYWAIMETVKKRFDVEGISIPFPQRDVHLYTHNCEEKAEA